MLISIFIINSEIGTRLARGIDEGDDGKFHMGRRRVIYVYKVMRVEGMGHRPMFMMSFMG